MATILAHIRVQPGRAAEFEKVARALYKGTHENEKRFHHYEYWRGAEPGLYYCLLAFEDFLAFLEHQTSDHHETQGAELGPLVSDIKLEWVDPVAGASKLPPTDMQELPTDANELTRRYHEAYAATVQEWWQALRKEGAV